MPSKYKYAHIMWVVGSEPIRLIVGGGKGKKSEEMGMREPDSNQIDEVVRAKRVDFFRLPRRMTDGEVQDWIDQEPERLENRLEICKEEVREDFIDDDGEIKLSI